MIKPFQHFAGVTCPKCLCEEQRRKYVETFRYMMRRRYAYLGGGAEEVLVTHQLAVSCKECRYTFGYEHTADHQDDA